MSSKDKREQNVDQTPLSQWSFLVESNMQCEWVDKHVYIHLITQCKFNSSHDYPMHCNLERTAGRTSQHACLSFSIGPATMTLLQDNVTDTTNYAFFMHVFNKQTFTYIVW
jgi:hypothetical protein